MSVELQNIRLSSGVVECVLVDVLRETDGRVRLAMVLGAARVRPYPGRKERELTPGMFLFWAPHRNFFIVAKGLPEALDVCRAIQRDYTDHDLPDLQTVRDGIYAYALRMFEGRAVHETSGSEEMARQLLLAEKFRDWTRPRQIDISQIVTEDSVKEPDVVERAIACLVSIGEDVGIREDEIRATLLRVGEDELLLEAMRTEMLRFLEVLRIKVQAIRAVLGGVDVTPKVCEIKEELQSRAWPRPVASFVKEIESDLDQIPGAIQDGQEEQVKRLLVAILLQIELQIFALTDFADFRSFLGGRSPHRTHKAYQVYLQGRAIELSRWLESRRDRGRRTFSRRPELVSMLWSHMVAVQSCVHNQDYAGAKRNLRAMARYFSGD